MPITRPRASSSGPPELPGLIAASVWIASPIWNSVSDSIVRSSAEIDADRQRLALAERAADRRHRLADLQPRRWWPSGSGRSVRPSGSTFSSATSAFGSSPTIVAGDLVAVGELDVDLARALGARSPSLGRDDVRVGGDVAVAVEHEAGALAALAAGRRGARRAAVEAARGRSPRPATALVDRAPGRSRLPGESLRRTSTRVVVHARRVRVGRPASSAAAFESPPPQPASTRRRPAQRRRPSARRPHERQLERERRAPGHGVHAQLAVHALRELAGDRQAEARALRAVVAGEEAARRRGGMVCRRMPRPGRRPSSRHAARCRATRSTTTSVSRRACGARALSSRIRTICATRSRSQIGLGSASRWRRSSRSESCCGQRAA